MPDAQHGLCNLLTSGNFVPTHDLKPGLPPGSARDAEDQRFAQARSRRVVYDKHTVPDDCPLRHEDFTITVAGGN